ncbi:hypothetical protein PtB15_14B248 [Puccinia triticina]|nr:hypothetical protein PtB15_14B248 [Puccinia triticina]
MVSAANLVEERIQSYHKNQQANPSLKKPFCLRYPTYVDVINHSISSEDKCEVLPGNSMVILIDEGGICIGVGLPPKPRSTQSLHVPRDVRARERLDQFVADNVLQSNNNAVIRAGQTPIQFPISTFPLSMDTKGELRAGKDAKKSTLSFQAYGYGLGSPLSTGAADKTIKCSTHLIKTNQLQGYGDKWKSDPQPNLPEPLRSETGPKMRGLVELRHDMTTANITKLTEPFSRTKLSNVVSEVIKEEDEAADNQHQLSQDSDNPGQPNHQKQIDGWTALIHHNPQPPPDQTLPADQQTQQDQP